MRKRNGKIELMRFVFTISVLIFHINLSLWSGKKGFTDTVSVFSHGNLGVEFFFLVSGFLMAKTLSHFSEPSSDWNKLASETLSFLWRKVKGILPYHIVYCLIIMALMVIIYPNKQPEQLFKVLPTFLFLHRTGIVLGGSLLGVEWYISSMLIAMAILYPIGRKYNHFFTKIMAPLAGLLIIGWMTQSYGCLSDGDYWNGLTFHCNLRAIAELCLGSACYEIAESMKKHIFSGVQKFFLSVAELTGYGAALFYICSFFASKYEVYILLLLCVSVTISFSQKSFFGQSILFQNPLCEFLGAISLPIYLVQKIAKEVVVFLLPELRAAYQAYLILFFSIAWGAISYLIWTSIQHRHTA